MNKFKCIITILLFVCITVTSQTFSVPEYTITNRSFFALSVTNVEESVEWYSNILGLKIVKEVNTAGDKIKIRIMERQGLLVELVERADAFDIEKYEPDLNSRSMLRGIYKAGFYVEDAQALFDQFRELGVEFKGKMFIEDDLNQKSFLIKDNSGNLLQIFQKTN